MKLLLNSASRLPGPSGNQSEKVHGQSEERYTIDAFKFPPEAYKVVFFHTSNHGAFDHRQARNNVGQLIDYVDMLINVLVQLEADYAKAIAELQTGANSP